MAAIRPGRPAAKKAAAAPQAEAPPPPPAAAPKNRSMTVPAIIVAAAILGGFFLTKGGRGETPTNAAATPTTVHAGEGDVVSLEPITMNLSGGDILKVGIALQLAAETPEAEEAVEDPAAFGARALDETIIVLGGFTKAELLREGGVAEAKAQLSARVAELYHDAVLAVYFTQLVVA